MTKGILLFLSLVIASACGSARNAPSAARAELAPIGALRAGLIFSNQVLVTRDPVTGELRVVTINLGKALAARLIGTDPLRPNPVRVQFLQPLGQLGYIEGQKSGSSNP